MVKFLFYFGWYLVANLVEGKVLAEISPHHSNSVRECASRDRLWRVNSAVQRQTAVTAYFSSKQLLLFAFARQNLYCGPMLTQSEYDNDPLEVGQRAKWSVSRTGAKSDQLSVKYRVHPHSLITSKHIGSQGFK